MIYFKHFTDCNSDEKLVRLKEIYGFAGIGRWWEVVRIIAEQMDASDRCGAEYPPWFWAKNLGFPRKDYALQYIKTLVQLKLLEWGSGGEAEGYRRRTGGLPDGVPNALVDDYLHTRLWHLRCPNLLKLRGGRWVKTESSVHPDKDKDKDKDKELIHKRSAEKILPNPNLPKPQKISVSAEGFFLGIPETKIQNWKQAYPAVNVDTELRKASAWIFANPKNKKSNYERFIVNWLSRAQDKAPRAESVNGHTEAFDQWQKIISHVKRFGSQTSIKELSIQATIALRAIGGMSAVGQANNFQLTEIKKQFFENYTGEKT